jgi:hypothetical protein
VSVCALHHHGEIGASRCHTPWSTDSFGMASFVAGGFSREGARVLFRSVLGVTSYFAALQRRRAEPRRIVQRLRIL